MRKSKPIVCTLTGRERRERATAWSTALQRAAIGVEECNGGYVITLRDEERLLAEINGLIEAERTCCAWMTLELRLDAPMTLTVTLGTRPHDSSQR